MKKIISFLASLSLVAVSASSVTACARTNGYASSDENDDGYDNSDLSAFYKTGYNFQTGPDSSSKDLNHNYSDDYITAFNGSAESTYSVYSTDKGIFNPEFYGNKDQVLKTSDDNFKASGWLNDKINFQTIIAFKKDVDKYSDIKISLTDNTKDGSGNAIDKSQMLTGDIDFEKYILTENHHTSALDSTIKRDRQYIPDALEGDYLTNLYQNVSDDGIISHKVPFDIQVAYVDLNTTKQTLIGEHNVQIKLSYKYNNQQVTPEMIKDTKVDVKNIVLNRDDYDENEDGKVDYADKFGLSTSTFPVNGQHQWNGDVYDNLPDVEVAEKLGTSSWDTPLDPKFKGKDISLNLAYISNGSNLSFNLNNQKISFAVDRTDLNFFALINVEQKGKLIGSYRIYYNQLGKPTYNAVYNNPGEGNENTHDINGNGDGIENKANWDIDGDGVYTRNDWDAAGNVDASNKEIGDDIGPNINYGDYVRRTPTSWDRLNAEYKPLQQTNDMSISGTGTSKQLIQYSGKLVDSKLNAGFNGKATGPADDYEEALANANLNATNFRKFMTSTPDHNWTWNFDFTNLDLYMRLAAKNNIPSVQINPVDVGGFSFYYLKGANAKIGPQRGMIYKSDLSMIDKSSGKLADTGVVFVDNVIAPLAQQLSAHLANVVNKNPEYKLSDGKTPVRLYFSFDEDNEETVTDTMKVVRANSLPNGRIYSSCFLGWRSNTSHAAFDSKYFKEDMSNEYMDQIVFIFRSLTNNAKNSDLTSIRTMIQNRNARGQTTMFYTTWDSTPGGYLQNDLSDDYWQMLFSYRLGLNGYYRWAYDNVYTDTFNNSVSHDQDQAKYNKNPESNSIHVTGQEYLIYGGSDSKGVIYSVRLKAYIEALNYVYKIKQILHSENIEERNEIAMGLISIAKSKSTYQNNGWKWNGMQNANPQDFQMPGNSYPISNSEQVYKVTSLIDSFDEI